MLDPTARRHYHKILKISRRNLQEWALLNCGHLSPSDGSYVVGESLKCLVCVNLPPREFRIPGVPLADPRRAPKELLTEMRAVNHPVWRDAEERMLALLRIIHYPHTFVSPNRISIPDGVIVIKGDLLYGRFQRKIRDYPEADRTMIAANRKALKLASRGWRREGLTVYEIWASDAVWPKIARKLLLWRLPGGPR